MRFGITANPSSERARRLAKRFLSVIPKEHEVIVEDDLAHTLEERGIPLKEIACDVLVAIGGDGTILRAMQVQDTPILGVDAGIVGFLTEVKEDDIEQSVERTIRKDYLLDERPKLKVLVDQKRLFDCTNEAVIHTSSISKMRHFQVRINGKVAEEVRADGVIVATPTGSTSYTMSVGGPIVDPAVQAIVIALIAPFKLSIRPLVVSLESTIEISLINPRPCTLVLDGQAEFPLNGHERLTFAQSEKKARFIRFSQDFYKRIEEKLLTQ